MLVILEMANNHGGSVELGKQIIREHAEVTRKFPQFEYAFKFQYRDLPTFIHPSSDPEHKYVKRFRETNLSDTDRIALKDYAKEFGFKVGCTPFDEKSVEDVVRHGYDYLKVGSPSFTDWPLWECIHRLWSGPIIASCGGATVEEIDRVVAMNPDRFLVLMHCVSGYPTQNGDLQLSQIDWLKIRYPNIPVGHSTHAMTTMGATVAAAKGVGAMEFHVCAGDKPNEYSRDSEDMRRELGVIFVVSSLSGRLPGHRVPGPKPTQFMRQEIDGKYWWKPE